MTNQFKPSDFATRAEYEKHAVALERAQTLNFRLFQIWNDYIDFIRPESALYINLLAVLDEAVQIGYEAGIGKPHKASDYHIPEECLADHENACWFCKSAAHRLGELECLLDECKFEAKEFFD